VLIAFFYRNATLDKLVSLPDETTLFEEDGIAVEQRGTPRMTYYGKCRIRITSKRIIIAQKMLLMKNRYMLRFVISFSSDAPAPDLKTILKKGYYITNTQKNKIIFNPDDKGYTLISFPVSKRWTIQFTTKAGSDYMKILKEV
jgi:hypothetical protein